MPMTLLIKTPANGSFSSTTTRQKARFAILNLRFDVVDGYDLGGLLYEPKEPSKPKHAVVSVAAAILGCRRRKGALNLCRL